MTQIEALAEAKKLFPEIAEFLTLERQHSVGFERGHMDEFFIWDHSFGKCEILAHSIRSWEHALSIAKSEDDDQWEQDSSEVEPEGGVVCG